MGGVSGRAPVAISAFLKRSNSPPAAMASDPVKCASLKYTSTPASLNRRAAEARLRRA